MCKVRQGHFGNNITFKGRGLIKIGKFVNYGAGCFMTMSQKYEERVQKLSFLARLHFTGELKY